MENKNTAEVMKAREHDLATDAAEAAVSGVGVKEVLEGIETGVVDTYKAVEEGVVGAYKAVEDAVVGAYKNVEDRFVETFIAKEGETVEEAKARITGKE